MMDYEDIEELLRAFYDGTISQEGLDSLCRYFLSHPEAATRWPDDARLLVPLALARFSYKGKVALRQKGPVATMVEPVGRRRRSRLLRYAAVVALMLGISAVGYYFVFCEFHYTSNIDMSENEVLEWFDYTIKSAS